MVLHLNSRGVKLDRPVFWTLCENSWHCLQVANLLLKFTIKEGHLDTVPAHRATVKEPQRFM
jgi:hypothetical protein